MKTTLKFCLTSAGAMTLLTTTAAALTFNCWAADGAERCPEAVYYQGIRCLIMGPTQQYRPRVKNLYPLGRGSGHRGWKYSTENNCYYNCNGKYLYVPNEQGMIPDPETEQCQVNP